MGRIGSNVRVDYVKAMDRQGSIRRNLINAPIKDTVVSSLELFVAGRSKILVNRPLFDLGRSRRWIHHRSFCSWQSRYKRASTLTDKSRLLSNMLFRLLAVPLPLGLSYGSWNGAHLQSWHSWRVSSCSEKFPDMWRLAWRRRWWSSEQSSFITSDFISILLVPRVTPSPVNSLKNRTDK